MQFPYVVSPLTIDLVILGLFSVWITARAYSPSLREGAPSQSRNRWWRLLDISIDVSWWTPHETPAPHTVDGLKFGIETVTKDTTGDAGLISLRASSRSTRFGLSFLGKPKNYFSL